MASNRLTLETNPGDKLMDSLNNLSINPEGPSNILKTKILQFRENIKAGNLSELKEFVENHHSLRLCYGNSQVCALEYSIDCKRLDIY